jgi:hypothetical protein
MKHYISLNATRNLLEKYWYWEVPETTVNNVRNVFIKQLEETTQEIIRIHNEQDRLREIHNLPPLKRLSFNPEVLPNTFKWVVDLDPGSTGQHNRDTVVSDKQDIEVI